MQHCFSEELLDSTVHFQVMDLGRQLYIWVGTSAAQMGSLCFASPTGTLSLPIVNLSDFAGLSHL